MNSVDARVQYSAPDRPRELSPVKLFCVTAFGFGIVYYWSALTSILLPERVSELFPGGHKGTALGAITSVGSVILIALEPLVGVLSDRGRSRWGKRTPFIVFGTAGMCLLLPLMFAVPTPALLLACFVVLKVFWACAEATFPALIPDMIPETQRATATGWLGLLQLLGATAGAFVTGKIIGNAALVERFVPFSPLVVATGATAVVLAGCASVVFLFVKEPPATLSPPRPDRSALLEAFEFRPLLQQRALLRLTFSRTAWYFGFVTVQTLLLFFVRDVLHIERYADATASLFSVLFASALPSVYLAGWWSDRIGRRKPFIYVSSGIMIVAAMGFLLMRSYPQALFAMAIWGVGGGMFISTSMAMATESFPEAGSNARYLALWMAISQSVPWLIAPPIGGILLDHFGFGAVFVFVIVCFAAGLVLFHRVAETGHRHRAHPAEFLAEAP